MRKATLILLTVFMLITLALCPACACSPGESDNSTTPNGSDNVTPDGDYGDPSEYSWTKMASPTPNDLLNVWGSSATDVFAVGKGGVILHYDGSTWSQMTSGTEGDLYGVWGSSSTDVYAVGYYRHLGVALHYDGITWDPVATGSTAYVFGIWGTSASDVFVVGDHGVILHYDGNDWSTMPSGTSEILSDVGGSAAKDVFAVGDHGVIVHYDGNSWSPMPSATSGFLNDLWNGSPTDVYAVIYNGDILHYDGQAWTSMGFEFEANRVCVTWAGIFAVGPTDYIWRHDGSSWGSMDNPTSQPVYGIWASPESVVFAVGGSGNIVHYVRIAGSTSP